jgi:hypothetical protein
MPAPAFNPLISRLSPPPVPAVFAWARAYDGARGPLIDLSQAVPGYPPHPDMLTLARRPPRAPMPATARSKASRTCAQPMR